MPMEVRAKKALGQHFLTDQSIAMKIVDSLGRSSWRRAGAMQKDCAVR